MANNPNYHSYLLRFWRDNADQPWRASLQSTVTEEKIFFADPTCLLDFLMTTLTLGEADGASAGEAPPVANPKQP
jgi:hypothetical protein